MWKQKYSPVAGLISTKNKGTCKAQPQTMYMVCLNCERGSQLSKSSGPKTIPVDGSNTFTLLRQSVQCKESWSVNLETWVLAPALLLTTYKTLSKALNVSGTNLLTCKIRQFDSITVSPVLDIVLCGFIESAEQLCQENIIRVPWGRKCLFYCTYLSFL